MGIVSRLLLAILQINLLGFGFESLAHTKNPEAAILKEACEGQLTGEALNEARSRWTGKTVILDTNVLLADPNSIYKYPGASIVLPGTVFEELDNNKKDPQIGHVARQVIRMFDDLIKRGNPANGIKIGHGSTLKIDWQDYRHVLEGTSFDPKKQDNAIVAMALAYTYAVPGHGNVVLISNDGTVRIKTASLEMIGMPFEYEWVSADQKTKKLYHELKLSPQDLQQALRDGSMKKPADLKIAANEFVHLVTDETAGSPATLETIFRYVYDRENPEESGLMALRDFSDLPFPPKNVEQAMAMDVLLDPDVQLVILDAPAGTGKTFISLEAMVYQWKNSVYGRGLITRPLVHLGKTELGALPGDKDAKLFEHFAAFFDNWHVMKSRLGNQGQPPDSNHSQRYKNREERRKQSQNPAKPEKSLAKTFDLGKETFNNGKPVKIPGTDLLPFPHIRGRSFHQTFMIVDETQNTSVHEIKTMLTRLAAGSKVVIMGDPSQIDTPYLTENNNGLSVSINLFTQDRWSDEQRSRVAVVRLVESVREPFTQFAIEVFKSPRETGE